MYRQIYLTILFQEPLYWWICTSLDLQVLCTYFPLKGHQSIILRGVPLSVAFVRRPFTLPVFAVYMQKWISGGVEGLGMVLPLQSVTDPPMQGVHVWARMNMHRKYIVLSHTCRAKVQFPTCLTSGYWVSYVLTPIQQICWRIARAVCHADTGNVYNIQPYPTDILHSVNFTFHPVCTLSWPCTSPTHPQSSPALLHTIIVIPHIIHCCRSLWK